MCVREYLGKVKLLSFQHLTHPAIIFGWSQISNSIPILRGKIVRFLLVKSIMTHILKKNHEDVPHNIDNIVQLVTYLQLP